MPTGSIEQQQSLKNQVVVYFRGTLVGETKKCFATAFINGTRVAEVEADTLAKVKSFIGYESQGSHDLYSACFNGEDFTVIPFTQVDTEGEEYPNG